eukprot:gnl/Spiro4/3142_TR1527_c0_g1_i1.p1 gnl/Spiro4/3142_TR1527_c0_g1~~gnl/Spiro4/3142_TR1527_c0_g1_i1.p1  ORF type:complete len:312 (-),score=72.44 gnl/Spiro4/3142_TR1527_c0_g1_i1:62-928(-)
MDTADVVAQVADNGWRLSPLEKKRAEVALRRTLCEAQQLTADIDSIFVNTGLVDPKLGEISVQISKIISAQKLGALPKAAAPKTVESSRKHTLMLDKPESKRVHIFFSSTFRDMQLDRDVIMKRVLPQLNDFCALRGVTLTYADLRWGLTEEMTAHGDCVKLCLDEISRSQVFVGHLGARYGWIPDLQQASQVSQATVAAYPWIAGMHGISVTEMEIEYGLFQGPKSRPALFYFRNHAWRGPPDLDEAQRAIFDSESPRHAAMQASLIERSRQTVAERAHAMPSAVCT